MGLNKGQTNNTSFKKGIIPWIKGKTHSKATRNKLRLSHLGKKLSPESIRKRTETRKKLYLEGKLVSPMKGKHQTEKAKKLIGEASSSRIRSQITINKISGKNNCNWKGGITTLRNYIRNSLQYKRWLCACMERDNWTCIVCSQRGGDLHVHHIKLFSDILKDNHIESKKQAKSCKELWDLNNGITLCVECHKFAHEYLKSVEKQNKMNMPLFTYTTSMNERREKKNK